MSASADKLMNSHRSQRTFSAENVRCEEGSVVIHSDTVKTDVQTHQHSNASVPVAQVYFLGCHHNILTLSSGIGENFDTSKNISAELLMVLLQDFDREYMKWDF